MTLPKYIHTQSRREIRNKRCLNYLVVNELQNLGVAGERLEEEREVSETMFLCLSLYLCIC